MEEEVERRVRGERGRQHKQRRARARSQNQRDAADARCDQRGRAERPTRPGSEERVPEREGHPPQRRARRQHLDAREIFTGLCKERVEVAGHATGDDHQRHRPDEHADGERDSAAQERPRRIPAHAIEQDDREQRQRQDGGLGPQPDGGSGEERGDEDAPPSARKALAVFAPCRLAARSVAPTGGTLSEEGGRKQRLHHGGHGEPGHVAQRPAAGEQEEGTARRHDRRRQCAAFVAFEAPEELPERDDRQGTEQRTEQRERRRFGDFDLRPGGVGSRLAPRGGWGAGRVAARRMAGDEQQGELAQCDVERIAGRMRLVAGDIEVAHAQDEVGGVKIVGRRRQVRQSREGRGGGERRHDPAGCPRRATDSLHERSRSAVRRRPRSVRSEPPPRQATAMPSAAAPASSATARRPPVSGARPR